MGTDSPGTEQSPQAPGGSCLGQGVLEPRAFPVPSQAGSGDSGLAAVTSCPYHVPLAWHCAPNCHGHWGWILGAQPHGRFSQRNWDWPWGRGHSLIVPVPPALGSSCAGAISAPESPAALAVPIPDVPQHRGDADGCHKIGECSGGDFSSLHHWLIPFLPVADPWQAGRGGKLRHDAGMCVGEPSGFFPATLSHLLLSQSPCLCATSRAGTARAREGPGKGQGSQVSGGKKCSLSPPGIWGN